jgi:hypothetical protein
MYLDIKTGFIYKLFMLLNIEIDRSCVPTFISNLLLSFVPNKVSYLIHNNLHII